MNNLYIVMPAYNEEANIDATVKSWYPLLNLAGENSKLIVADSGSNDRTHEILLGLKDYLPKLEILETDDPGHGPKLIALYGYAIDNGADLIFQTDSDGQTNPAEFEAFYKALGEENLDAVIGTRPVRGDGKSRAFVEKVVCMLLGLYFGIKVTDANAPFRLMKSEMVARYLSRFDKHYALPNIMLTTFFVYYKEKVAFKEITFKPRAIGKSSLNIPKITKIGFHALSDFRRFKKGL